VIPHLPPTPYSLDLTPCDFFLFPTKMKLWLKGHSFDTTEEIHAESQKVFDALTFENFQGCMKSWGNMLRSLFTCPNRLLRRRRRKLGVIVKNFFLMVKFSEV
jgi:hypothetical protein